MLKLFGTKKSVFGTPNTHARTHACTHARTHTHTQTHTQTRVDIAVLERETQVAVTTGLKEGGVWLCSRAEASSRWFCQDERWERGSHEGKTAYLILEGAPGRGRGEGQGRRLVSLQPEPHIHGLANKRQIVTTVENIV